MRVRTNTLFVCGQIVYKKLVSSLETAFRVPGCNLVCSFCLVHVWFLVFRKSPYPPDGWFLRRQNKYSQPELTISTTWLKAEFVATCYVPSRLFRKLRMRRQSLIFYWVSQNDRRYQTSSLWRMANYIEVLPVRAF